MEGGRKWSAIKTEKERQSQGSKNLEEFSFIILSFPVEALNPEFIKASLHSHPNPP